MADYFFREEDLDEFERSGDLGKLVEKMNAMIARIAGVFIHLTTDQQKACEAIARKYLILDDHRCARQAENLADDEEIATELHDEMPEIRSQIVGWFPFVDEGSEQEQDEQVLAFLEYFDTRRAAQ